MECKIQGSVVQFNCKGEYESATSYGIIINLILFNWCVADSDIYILFRTLFQRHGFLYHGEMSKRCTGIFFVCLSYCVQKESVLGVIRLETVSCVVNTWHSFQFCGKYHVMKLWYWTRLLRMRIWPTNTSYSDQKWPEHGMGGDPKYFLQFSQELN